MKFRFGILCFPAVQQLDLTGPYEVFASAAGAEVHLVWKDLEPVRSSTGPWLKPDTSCADAPDFDVVCVTNRAGVNPLLSAEETLAFLRDKGARTAVAQGAWLWTRSLESFARSVAPQLKGTLTEVEGSQGWVSDSHEQFIKSSASGRAAANDREL